jgi:CrcB protein
MLLVFLGGAAGTVSRYLLSLVIPTVGGFPLATFSVNLVGAFVLGVLLEGLLRGGNDVGWRQRVRLLFGPGFLGGFTTYSSLCVEGVLLTENGQYVTGGSYAVASLLLGVAAAAAGVWVAANLFEVPEVVPGSEHSSVTSTQILHLARAALNGDDPVGRHAPDAERAALAKAKPESPEHEPLDDTEDGIR